MTHPSLLTTLNGWFFCGVIAFSFYYLEGFYLAKTLPIQGGKGFLLSNY